MATNRVNDKEYVGQTVGGLAKRKREHVWCALNKTHNMCFHKAIRKYGSENFDWEILHNDISNIDDLNKLEIYYIGLYNTYNNGYNSTIGGWGTVGLGCDIKTKKKISKANSGKNNGMYGRSISEWQKQRISEVNTGKVRSAETRKQISETRIRKGISPDEEHRRKISESLKGRKKSIEERKKLSIATSGKNNPMAVAVIINNKYFDTRKEAAKFIGVDPKTVSNRILHKTRWQDYSYAK